MSEFDPVGIPAHSDMYFDEDGDLRSSTTAKTYGGITRGDFPQPNYKDAGTGTLTLEMILEMFSPERLEREHRADMERHRQQAEMMKPYQGAPFPVYAAAWRLMISNFGYPLHSDDAKRLTAVIDEWKAANG